MANFPSDILSHFAPFHEWLDEIKERSDFTYQEGGMTWQSDFSRRKSDLDRNILRSLKEKRQFGSIENINDINLMWSRFYWNAAGYGGSLQEITNDHEWSKEEASLTEKYLEKVVFVTDLFVSAQATGYMISFEEDDVSIYVHCVTLFGKKLLEHEIFWSID